MSNTVTKAEFARIIGRDSGWVTRLAQRGRLVLEGEGREARVLVAESKALIEQTRASRDDVAARHADKRSAHGSSGVVPPAYDPGDSMEKARRIKVVSEARRFAAAADREEMERDKLAGDLIAREDVDAAMKFIGASVRGLAEVFADQIAPIVAPMTNLDEVHAALAEARRDELVRLGEAIERQQAALAKGGAA
jgi:hypothetical protein